MLLRLLLLLFFLSGIQYGISQFIFKNTFEINFEMGYSNNLSSVDGYFLTTVNDIVNINHKSPSRKFNYNLAFTRFLNDKNGFKLTYGIAQYGFILNATIANQKTNLNLIYEVKSREIGLSYVRVLAYDSFGRYTFEPGILLNVNGEGQNDIRISRKSGIALSLNSEYEFPMIGNNLFATLGLQLKLPLTSFSRTASSNYPKNYYPIFFGVKFGFNFQAKPFEAAKKEFDLYQITF